MNGLVRHVNWQSAVIGLCLILLQAIVMADDNTPVYSRYSLSASASVEIENDLMTVQLVVEDEDTDSAALAERINQKMLWALLQLEQFHSIKSSTRDYNTYPIYEQKRISGWRSSQTLQLQGSMFDDIKRAIGKLQERLTVRSMRFSPRPETRKMTENKLIDEALEAFRERADLISKSMNASGYRVIHAGVNTDDHRAPMFREAMAADMQVRNKAVSAPSIDAGTSQITVAVHGEIQLQ